ncbi:hypothetical protein [Melghirimyces profundicolus]|uniref:hypothetical protein n=1 Tax=Melghirimyces profundicolus TaxID=1242148 RepID=UPI000D3CA2E7|nr:hypothetical protein [Melghirimyces profundicolus]
MSRRCIIGLILASLLLVLSGFWWGVQMQEKQPTEGLKREPRVQMEEGSSEWRSFFFAFRVFLPPNQKDRGFTRPFHRLIRS